MTIDWDIRFLKNAQLIASWSKYPGLHVGCVVVDNAKTQLSGGFNGFPRGIRDDERLHEREKAIRMVVHAEANAVAAAAMKGHSLKDSRLYTTHRPCPQCAALIIQAGVKSVVSIYGQNELSSSGTDWKPEFDFATWMLMEAMVDVRLVDMESKLAWCPFGGPLMEVVWKRVVPGTSRPYFRL